MLEPTNSVILSSQEGVKHSCESCKKEGFDHQWMQLGKYWLCRPCKSRIDARLKEVNQGSELVQKESKPAVIVDEAELKGLKADGLVSLRAYIYLALRIGGITEKLKNVEIDDFCQQWQVCREDFIGAIAGLSKKGIVCLNVQNLSAQAFTRDERLQSLESSASSTKSIEV